MSAFMCYATCHFDVQLVKLWDGQIRGWLKSVDPNLTFIPGNRKLFVMDLLVQGKLGNSLSRLIWFLEIWDQLEIETLSRMW